jgi:hypothetical protein
LAPRRNEDPRYVSAKKDRRTISAPMTARSTLVESQIL